MKHNRGYKDSVFVDYFGVDISAKKNFLSLYNALHGTHLDASCEVKPLRIEKTLYTKLTNDVSYLVDNKIIVLAEHQSTVNENMPLRFLEYVARLYESIQEPRAKYYRTLQKIPSPEFYVFYNGVEEYPERKVLRLSDAFIVKGEKVPLELIVEVININTGKQDEVLKKCEEMKDYSLFVESVRRNLAADKENGFEEAIRECIKSGIMREYLERKSREVINMLIDEYDYDTDIAVRTEEAYALGEEKGIELGMALGEKRGRNEGIELGRSEGIELGRSESSKMTAKALKLMGLPIEQIAKATGLSEEEIEKL